MGVLLALTSTSHGAEKPLLFEAEHFATLYNFVRDAPQSRESVNGADPIMGLSIKTARSFTGVIQTGKRAQQATHHTPKHSHPSSARSALEVELGG